MFRYFLVAWNFTKTLLKFSVLEEQSWNWHVIMHSKKTWSSKLKKKKICNSDDTELHYFPIEKHVKYGFHPAKCLSNSSGGLGTMSFSGITQQLKSRLKANVLLCFPKPGFKCHSEKHSVV